MKLIPHFLVFALLALSSCKASPERPYLRKSGDSQGIDPNQPGGQLPNQPPSGGGGGTGGGGGDPGGVDEPIKIIFNTALPRLTHEEWENTVRDVFLLSARPGLAKNFSADDSSSVFHNDSSLNKVTSNLWKDYQEAAEEFGKRIAANTTQLKKLIPNGTPAAENAERAKAILKPLLNRAFRRSATEDELKILSEIFVKGKTLTDRTDFDGAGMQAVTAAILQSPQFLYQNQYGVKDDLLAKLSPTEVATRLSYAIWKSIPDDELFKAAESGKLTTDDEIRAQVVRMFKDPRADATIRFFYNELFTTARFSDLQKDPALFPKYPKDMGNTLTREAELFIEDVIIKNNGGISTLLTANHTFVNDKTAPLYEVALPGTMEFRRVELDPKKRAGLLTQLGWLSMMSSNTATSTIRRGAYIMARIACDDMGVQFGDDSPEDKDFKTRRERVESLTSSCGGSCHNNHINPPAFALEAYDAIGMFRTTENGHPINTKGVYGIKTALDSPTPFDNAVEMVQGIVKRTTTHECHIKRAIELLYNRSSNDQDRAAVKRLGKLSLDGMGTRDIMIELLSDPDLLMKRSDNSTAK